MVKTIEEIKGYLSEGKFPQQQQFMDIIDTLVSLYSNNISGLRQVNLDVYDGENAGEIVQHIGLDGAYTHGFIYEYKSKSKSVAQGTWYIEIPKNSYGIKPGLYCDTGNYGTERYFVKLGNTNTTKATPRIYADEAGNTIEVLHGGFPSCVPIGQFNAYGSEYVVEYMYQRADENITINTTGWERLDVQPPIIWNNHDQ